MHQVLGEMYKPHVYFRHTSLITVAVVCLLYMLVNVMFVSDPFRRLSFVMSLTLAARRSASERESQFYL